jgi:hypothetical protein
MKPILFESINRFANASTINERTYDINHLLKLFGHCGQVTLKHMVKMFGFKSSGNSETC